MDIKITSPYSEPKNISINNNIILNKSTFLIAKLSVASSYPPLAKIDFDTIQPLILAIEEYQKTNPKFDFVEVESKNGNTICISF